MRTFALPRMTRFKTTSIKIERPKHFNKIEPLKRSFIIWSVVENISRQRVRVDLSARLAQEICPLNSKGTRVEIRFEIGRMEEVLSWVLSFGSQAKV